MKVLAEIEVPSDPGYCDYDCGDGFYIDCAYATPAPRCAVFGNDLQIDKESGRWMKVLKCQQSVTVNS